MAITNALATSAKLGWINGVYTPTDVYKIALYEISATLDSTTTAYTTANEVVGIGYTTGGQTLSGFNSANAGTSAIVTFDNPSWLNATITAGGAMIYNSSKADAAIAIIDFGSNITSTNGTFTIQFPAFTETTALIRLS